MNKTIEIIKKELEKTNKITLKDLVDEAEARQAEERMMREKEEQSKKLVDKEIWHNLCLTMEQEQKKDDFPLYECENYKEDAETGEYPEIMEYWAVSEWLGEQLTKQGEIVFECLDFIVWGRQGTGQAIYIDGVIKKIAKKLDW